MGLMNPDEYTPYSPEPRNAEGVRVGNPKAKSVAIDFEPLLDYVLVREDKTPKTTPGGIVLPDELQTAPVEGMVVAAGPGQPQNGVFVDNKIKVGMWVRFGAWANTRVKIGDEEFNIMRESDIIGRVPSKSK